MLLLKKLLRLHKKKQILAVKRIIPLINCNLGLSVQTRFSLKKKNINGRVKATVKKYLAQVIWKKDNSADKYLAIVSIKGKITHADKFRIIAFIKKKILKQYKL